MVFANLRREERIGLGLALALHAALGIALLVQPANREAIPPVKKMTVNLASEVGLEAAAPEPVAESRAAIAPVLAPEPAPMVEPAPVMRPRPEPPRPIATQSPRPRPTTASDPRRRPDAPASQVRPKPAGGSRVGADFLPGAGDSATTRETRAPASQIGASVRASLVQAIAREIKPKWNPPDGPEVNAITTYLRFRLNPDGSLSGKPEMLRQTGVNDVNRAQASRHAEQAVRAVQLAAPFDLPEEHYEAWKLVSPFSFDWKLAQ